MQEIWWIPLSYQLQCYLDFAVIFVMELQSTPEEKQSTNVTYELQKMWGVSIEDLWNAGMENLQKEGVAILSIEEITHGLLPEDGLGIYAMTTENMVRGSVSVLSEEVLKTNRGKSFVLYALMQSLVIGEIDSRISCCCSSVLANL